MAEKNKLTDDEMIQADGVADDESVTTDAETADAMSHSGLPMEPEDQRSARLQRELDESQDKMLRLAAEFDNFRKRAAKEKTELADRAQAAFVGRLLDVLDDLERLASDDNRQSGPLFDATVLIQRKLKKELESAGLERIEPTGTGFDPKRHEAVSTLPPPSPDQDHQVSATFQPGYAFKGNLIRPARVQVYTDQGQA